MADITPRTLPRDELVPWPDLNPRKRFLEEDMDELRASLRTDGMLLPLGVKLNDEPPHYVFAGERRLRAAEGILEEVPVIVRDIDEATAKRLALTENIQRNQLTPMEEAWGIRAYMDTDSGLTQTQVGEELGKSQGWVSNRLRLLRLPDEIQAQVQTEVLTPSQARDLILPFSVLPDELWEELAAAVATRLQKEEKATKERPLPEKDIRTHVATVATAMSGYLDDAIYNKEPWVEDVGLGVNDLHRVRIPKDRWSEAPKGTVVRYAYGYSTHHRSSRAFDATWWEEEIHRARQELQEEQEAKVEAEEGSRDLEWTPELGPMPADTTLEHRQRHVVLDFDQRTGAMRLRADPTELEPSMLVLRKGGPPRPSYDWHPEILCTSEAAWDAAADSMDEKVTGMIERMWARALEQEKEGAAELEPKEELPALVVAVQMKAATSAHQWSAPMLLDTVLADMELAPALPRGGGGADGVVFLDGLEAEVRREALQRTMYRFIKEDLTPYDRVTREAREKVQAMLLEELAEKLTFDMPTPYEEEEDDGEEDDQ